MPKKLQFLLLAFCTQLCISGCSSYLVLSDRSEDAVYSEINEECREQAVTLIFTDKTEKIGNFQSITRDFVSIKNDSLVTKYATEKIARIKYKDNFSISGMGMGTVLAAGAGFGLFYLTDLTGTSEGGEVNPLFLIGYPALVIAGGIWGGCELNITNTIILKK